MRTCNDCTHSCARSPEPHINDVSYWCRPKEHRVYSMDGATCEGHSALEVPDPIFALEPAPPKPQYHLLAPMRPVECSECGKVFETRVSNAKVCGAKCRIIRQNRFRKRTRVSRAVKGV